MIILMIVCVVIGSAVGGLLTAVAYTAVRNHLVERQLRQIQYWQGRAMMAENPEWRR
jgi:hypothetical protein